MTPRPINFRTLDLNLLRVFDVVMAERNVTRAAARLSMTQPAVSNALRRLREATQEELFVRSATGMQPTGHAQALWPTVRASLDSLQDALAPQGFDPRSDAQTFTLAMADATAALFVPVLTQALQRESAQVELQVVALATRDPRTLLEQGQADIALGFFPDLGGALAAEGNAARMRLEPLYDCAYVCVMRRGHALAVPGALTLDAYCAADHLRVNFAGRPRGFVDEALDRLQRERRVKITVNHFATAGHTVAQTDLLTVLPRSFLPATGLQAQLVTQPLPFELPGIEVGLLWHRRHERDTAQRWLRELLARTAAEIAARLQAAPEPPRPAG